MSSIKIAPSLLAADMLKLGQEISEIEHCGADFHHVDVMDGHFVPNLTFGPPLIKALKKIAKIPLDVHIMITNPEQTAMDYVDAGCDTLVFHIEAAVHHHRLLDEIRKRGVMAGVALNPSTPLLHLEPLLPFLDIVTIMSVNPGFGGQSFIHQSIERVNQLNQMISSHGSSCLIEVDGGITHENAKLLQKAGADILVAGTYIYGSQDRKKAIESLR